jgi:phage antirepressor YoqD-like protein
MQHTQVAPSAHVKTMSSREIANLVGSSHSNIKVSAKRLAKKGTIALQGSTFDHNGNTYTEFLLNKRDSLILVAQNCPEFTAAIVDRWQELESKQREFEVPQTMGEALRLAADLSDQVAAKNLLIEQQKPAVEFVDSYVKSTGNKSFRQVAKLLKIKEPAFRQFLSDHKIMYRLGGEWAAYQNHIDAGRFYVSTGTANDHAYTTTRFTPKGVSWISQKLKEIEENAVV